MINSVKKSFPDVKIICCSVHIDRSLDKQGKKNLGSQWLRIPNVYGLWWTGVRSMIYVDWMENQELIPIFEDYVRTLIDLVPRNRRRDAQKMVKYVLKQFHSRIFGYSNWRHVPEILNGFFDQTNNVSESLNAQLNVLIPDHRVPLTRVFGTIHGLQIDLVSKRTEMERDESLMGRKSAQHIERRDRITQKVRDFHAKPMEDKKMELVTFLTRVHEESDDNLDGSIGDLADLEIGLDEDEDENEEVALAIQPDDDSAEHRRIVHDEIEVIINHFLVTLIQKT